MSTLPQDLSVAPSTRALVGSAAVTALAAGGQAQAGPRKRLSRAQAARFLQQAQFSSTQSEIDVVLNLGMSDWIDGQMGVPVFERATKWMTARGFNTIDERTGFFMHRYFASFPLWKDLFTAPDQMRKRVALALTELFPIGIDAAPTFPQWYCYMYGHFWDMLNKHAFGNFRALLEDVTLSPAMGNFLNTDTNSKPNPATGSRPDENFARELMQLFTIGLVKLNQDGTPQLDPATQQPLKSYTQDDITALAHVFTGYRYDPGKPDESVWVPVPNSKGRKTLSTPAYTMLPMRVEPSLRSTATVQFMGTAVNCGDPANALDTVLDLLFHHPNVGPFIGRQMIQRLVTSNPSPAYVSRVAAAFNNNGKGVRGDLRALWRAILLDREAVDPANLGNANWGKLREPMLRFVQWGRSFGLKSLMGYWKVASVPFYGQGYGQYPDLSQPDFALGQSPGQSPSVFNFFRPGYVPPGGDFGQRKATAPEFQLLTETSVAGYLNFMQPTIRNGLWSNNAGSPVFCAWSALAPAGAVNGWDMVPDYTTELGLADNPAALVAHLNLVLCANQLSASTLQNIAKAIPPAGPSASRDDRLDRVASAIFLVMASPEYLVQK